MDFEHQSLFYPWNRHQRKDRIAIRTIIFVSIGFMAILFYLSIPLLRNTALEEYQKILKQVSITKPSWEQEAMAAFFADHIAVKDMDPKNFLEFAHCLRSFKILYDGYISQYPYHTYLLEEVLEDVMRQVDPVINSTDVIPYPASPLLWTTEQELFPWLQSNYSSLMQLQKTFQGKGIVIPTGSGHLRFAIHLIRSIRLMNCTLPIIVSYSGVGDLRDEEIKFLHDINVTTMDVSTKVNTTMLGLHSWFVKPFAALVAPFEEVILMDADTVFLQSPDVVFNDDGYKETGMMVFRDRTLFPNNKGQQEWIHKNIPKPLSSRLLESRMYKKESSHELESGVVVINKSKALHGLLAACKMNAKREREENTLKIFYGDKETFWLGMEMAGLNYTDTEVEGGSIGKLTVDPKGEKACVSGRIVHFDSLNQPLWFNGGVVLNKYTAEGSKVLQEFTHYAKGRDWDFGTNCLRGDNIIQLSDKDKDILKRLGEIWRPDYAYKEDFTNKTENINNTEF